MEMARSMVHDLFLIYGAVPSITYVPRISLALIRLIE